MIQQLLAAMRAGHDAQAAVLPRRRIQSDPRTAGRERPDRPVVAVLVERRLQAVPARLAEHLAAPQDDVLADGVRDELHELRVAREVEEISAALHAFLAVLEMGA